MLGRGEEAAGPEAFFCFLSPCLWNVLLRPSLTGLTHFHVISLIRIFSYFEGAPITERLRQPVKKQKKTAVITSQSQLPLSPPKVSGLIQRSHWTGNGVGFDFVLLAKIATAAAIWREREIGAI